MARLLTANVEAILKNARLGDKTRATVANDSPVLTDADRARLKAIATALGVNFDETEYTFEVSDTDNGRGIYDAIVALKEGVPVIHWGKSVTPLNVKLFSIETIEKKSFLAFDFEHETAVEGFETIYFPMTLKVLEEKPPEEGKKYPVRIVATADQLKRALKQNKLAEYLDSRKVFVRAEKLDILEPGEYTVIGYAKNRFGKFELTFEDGRVFTLKGNAIKRFEALPLVDADHPAVLTVGVGEEGTYNGKAYLKVPTSVLLWADTVPVGGEVRDASGNVVPVFSL